MEHGQEVSKALRSNKTEQRCIQWAWQPAASASAGLGCVCVWSWGCQGGRGSGRRTRRVSGENMARRRACRDPVLSVEGCRGQ